LGVYNREWCTNWDSEDVKLIVLEVSLWVISKRVVVWL
jgi:hypothetical protein